MHANKLYNEKENYFFEVPETMLELEHCLLALSKWESKWHKPFLTKDEKTREQTLDYVRCMCLTPGIDDKIFYALTSAQLKEIGEYIDDPMSATTINTSKNKGGSNKIVTSELIYYWMNESNISIECETWHLNRLLKLIEITSINRQPEKKMSRRDVMNQNRALNATRRAKHGSRG